MSVLGVIFLAVGIMFYADFCVLWKGQWKVVLALYACSVGATMLVLEHPWLMGWLTK